MSTKLTLEQAAARALAFFQVEIENPAVDTDHKDEEVAAALQAIADGTEGASLTPEHARHAIGFARANEDWDVVDAFEDLACGA